MTVLLLRVTQCLDFVSLWMCADSFHQLYGSLQRVGIGTYFPLISQSRRRLSSVPVDPVRCSRVGGGGGTQQS